VVIARFDDHATCRAVPTHNDQISIPAPESAELASAAQTGSVRVFAGTER
jgi:hypothetical protein